MCDSKRYIVNEQYVVVKRKKECLIYNIDSKVEIRTSHNVLDVLRFVHNTSTLPLIENEIINNLLKWNIIMESDSKESVLNIREQNLEMPLEIIQIEIISSCNFKCIHCYLPKNSYTETILEYETLIKIIDDAAKNGVIEIDITGGEPLLHPRILDLVSYIVKQKLFLRIFTNGYLLDNKTLEYFRECNIKALRISLDGLIEEHNHIRQCNCFNRIIENIKYASNLGIQIEITSILMKKNLSNASEMIEMIRSLNPSIHIIDTLVATDKSLEPLAITKEQYCEVMKKSTRNKNDKFTNNSCGILKNYMFIDNKGISKLCPTLPESLNGLSIYNYSITKAWKYLLEKYNNLVYCENISTCKYAKVCNGGCRSRAFYTTGNVCGKDEYMCKLMEEMYEN